MLTTLAVLLIKYRVTTEETVGALARICCAEPVAALTLIKQVAFAYLSCNGDAHAKNFSVRRLTRGEWRVTPGIDEVLDLPFDEGRLIKLRRSIECRRKRLEG